MDAAEIESQYEVLDDIIGWRNSTTHDPIEDVKIEGIYIHQTYIKSPFAEQTGLIIASEGPSRYNFNEFWKSVVDNKVSKIITFCEEFGLGGNWWTMYQYFPVNNEVKV